MTPVIDMARPHIHDTLCGPQCRYRSLYEGSQASLADMAARQAEALGRHGRLRAALLKVLRNTRPREYGAVESRIGRRLESVEDHVLVAVVADLVGAPTDRGELAALRHALEAAGYSLPPVDDLGLWAAAITTAPPDPTFPAPVPVPEGTGAPAAAPGLPSLSAAARASRPTVPEPAPPPRAPTPWTPAPPPVAPVPAGAPRTAPDGAGATPGDVDTALTELCDVFGTPVPDAHRLDPTAEPARTTAASRPDESAPPLRPRLFEAAPPRRRRTRRVSAEPPVEEPAPADLDELTRRIHAMVALPRPVFTSDLVELVGPEAVQAFERAARAERDPAVRFVNPKPRHRARGALVMPYAHLRQAALEFKDSWWGRCLRMYRGTALYEVAVLCHRLDDRVISVRPARHTLVMRVRQPRGLAGIIVLLDTDLLRGGPVRSGLEESLAELLSERLDLVAVLTVSGEPGAVERIAEVVRQDVAARGLVVDRPVVAARSWDWADGATANLVHVLG